MNIGRPTRIIEVEPANVPLPGSLPPFPDDVPAPPERAPEPAPEVPVSDEPTLP